MKKLHVGTKTNKFVIILAKFSEHFMFLLFGMPICQSFSQFLCTTRQSMSCFYKKSKLLWTWPNKTWSFWLIISNQKQPKIEFFYISYIRITNQPSSQKIAKLLLPMNESVPLTYDFLIKFYFSEIWTFILHREEKEEERSGGMIERCHKKRNRNIKS